MAAHRYWRVYITAVTGYPSLSITDVGLRTSVGGATVTTGGTPIESTHSSSGFDASKAFDGLNSTSWYINQSTAILPQWVGYDFGAGNAKDIVEFALTCWNVNEMAKDFQLQYSDDAANWSTLYTVEGETWSSANQVKAYSNSSTVAAGSAPKQFWRVRATAVDGSPSFFGLSELQMASSVGGANLCTGGTAYASSIGDGSNSPPSGAFDGVASNGPGNYWVSNGIPAWIAYKFPSAVNIQQVTITARPTYQNQSPKDFFVEYWDGNAYVIAKSVTGSSGWASLETRTFSFAPPSRAAVQVFVCT